MSRLKDLYKNEIMDAMTKKFGYKNVMEVPKLEKIVVNMGVGEAKENAKLLDAAIADMELVTDLRSMEGYQLIEHIVLENNDMKACNSASGEAVIPITVSRSKVDGGIMTSVLNKASWNVIRLKKQK